MRNCGVVIAVALISAIVVLIAVKGIRYFIRFNNDKKIKRTDGLIHMLAPSVVSIVVCVVCLCNTSWAWFTATTTSKVMKVQAAVYTVEVTAEDENGDEVGVTAIDEVGVTAKDENDSTVDVLLSEDRRISEYTITLKSNKSYALTIKAKGTANNGYCVVSLGGQAYYTPQMGKDASFTFIVNAYEEVEMTIKPQWGTCEVKDRIDSATPIIVGTEPSRLSTPISDIPMDTPDDVVLGEDDMVVPDDVVEPEITIDPDDSDDVDPIPEETPAPEPTPDAEEPEVTEMSDITES